MRIQKTLLPLLLTVILIVSAGCAHQRACAPPKYYSDPWVPNDETFPTVDACMTAIWKPGACSNETPGVADLQIKWALDCTAYCRRASDEDGTKSCLGIAMNQDHGRPLCKRLPYDSEAPAMINPWYIICADISVSCKCVPETRRKR